MPGKRAVRGGLIDATSNLLVARSNFPAISGSHPNIYDGRGWVVTFLPGSSFGVRVFAKCVTEAV